MAVTYNLQSCEVFSVVGGIGIFAFFVYGITKIVDN